MSRRERNSGRTRHAGSAAAATRIRSAGECLGAADSRAPHRELRSEDLDQLCLTGAVGWGRLSPHPATLAEDGETAIAAWFPTSVAPITFFIREDADWMISQHARLSSDGDPSGLSPAARERALIFLRQRGASFFADIVRGTGKHQSRSGNRAVGTGDCRNHHCRRFRQSFAR